MGLQEGIVMPKKRNQLRYGSSLSITGGQVGGAERSVKGDQRYVHPPEKLPPYAGYKFIDWKIFVQSF